MGTESRTTASPGARDSMVPQSTPQEFSVRGYVAPHRVCAEDQSKTIAADVLAALAGSSIKPPRSIISKFAQRHLRPRTPSRRTNRHFDWRPLAELASAESLIELAKSALGEEIVLWRSNLFIQSASRHEGLPWHRDIYPKIIRNPAKQISVQLALTDTTIDNCLEILPGSHDMQPEQLQKDYGLTTKRNQQRAGNISFRGGRDHEPNTQVVLSAGECILFAPQLLHRSSIAKQMVEPRVCITFRYTIPANLENSDGGPRSVVLSGNRTSYGKADKGIFDWRSGLPEHLTPIQ